MFGLLIDCLKRFGIGGLMVYLKFKFGRTSSLNLMGYEYPIRMRPTATDKTTFREIFLKREYDIALPPALKVQYIIDAGANIGFTSVFFANKYRGTTIISIEPDEENFTVLAENVRAYPGIKPLRTALWYKADTLNIIDAGLGKRGLMTEASANGGGLTSVSIPEIIARYGLPRIDILKMDIEGSEKEVFSENYDSWLPVTNCVIIELHDRMKPGCSKAVFAALSKYDFEFSIKGENLVFVKQAFIR